MARLGGGGAGLPEGPRGDILFQPLGTDAVLFDPVLQKLFLLDPAEAVAWCLYADGVPADGLAQTLRSHLAADGVDPDSWVPGVLQGWRAHGLLGDIPQASPAAMTSWRNEHSREGARDGAFPAGTARTYRLLDLSISVRCGEPALLAEMDRCLGYLAPGGDRSDQIEIAIAPHAQGWAVMTGQHLLEDGLAAGQQLPALMLALVRLALDHGEGGAAVHGAAVTDGQNAVLLTAEPGAGKSTLAAGCVLDGLRLAGEDTVVLQPHAGLIRPLPLPHCLKQGSWPVLAGRIADRVGIDVTSLPVHDRMDGRPVRFLPPVAAETRMTTLAAVVDPQWAAGAATQLRRLTPRQGFATLMPQLFPLRDGRVTPEERAPRLGGEMVAAVAGMAERLPFYRLTYDRLEDGIAAVRSLMP